MRGRCPVSSQCDSEVHRRGVQGTEGGSGRKHKRKVTAACNPGTGTRRRREARQERCDGERRSTPGGQPPGRVHMETGRWPCHHNLSYRSGSKVACGARRALQEAGRKAIGLKSKLGLDIGHGERMQRQGMRTAGPAAWLRRTGTGEMKGVASSGKPNHPGSAPWRAALSTSTLDGRSVTA